MRRWVAGALLSATALLFCPAFAASGAGARPVPAESSVTGWSDDKTLAEEKTPKVLCTFLLYGLPRNVCGEPPMSEVKKKCDEMASKDRGEKAECECTENQDYIQDTCD